jgi:uncharacterized membrane protein
MDMDLLVKINGLPAHPLIVHAAVVFTPLAALAALAYVVRPSWRDRLRIVMAVLVGIALVSIVAAYFSGINFRNSKAFLREGPIGDRVNTHRHDARLLLIATIPFSILGFASAWFHTREGAVRVALNGLLAISAVAVLVLVFVTGEAGARAVWSGS